MARLKGGTNHPDGSLLEKGPRPIRLSNLDKFLHISLGALMILICELAFLVFSLFMAIELP